MDQDLTRASRVFQDRIGDWVRARGYKGANATNLQCRRQLEGGREVLFDISRNKMWQYVEWVPSLNCLDPGVHHIMYIVAREAGDAIPPKGTIFGNRIRRLAGDKSNDFSAIRATIGLDSIFNEFCQSFEKAEKFFLMHTNTRAATLASLSDSETAARLCLITTMNREAKIAHMILLNQNREAIIDMLELYDSEPDDWKAAGLPSPFTKFKQRVLNTYLK